MPDLAQKSRKNAGIFFGLFDAGQMTRIADETKTAARDQVDGFTHQIRRRGSIL